ncbi:MAG: polysaccharide pyruvyl transferase family protein [Lachnospiraceae bacterium]|nr:polysaccharide pyruvyl transferase family protein [Lachnospiraceae bacterium]MDD3615904.1 polysaccharide pyruvyl transferase family protein [Lachnospiraceae bacterium]
MKKVFIHAYVAGNLGDDLFLKVLCQRFPRIQFRLYAGEDYRERLSELKNLKIYCPTDERTHRWDTFLQKVFHKENGFWKLLIKTSDAVVHIGGSIFTQHSDQWIDFYKMDALLLHMSKKLFLIGANFGPYSDEAYYDHYHDLFKNYAGICFRDAYSYRLFSDLPNTAYAPDVIYNYKNPAILPAANKSVVISVIYLNDRTGDQGLSSYCESYYTFIKNCAEYFLKKNYQIHFLSFCAFQNDTGAYEEIRGRMAEEYRDSVDMITYDRDTDSCVQAIAESEYVIGTRFHSIILGWLYGKKVLPISYDTKTTHILADQNIPLSVQIQDLDSISYENILKELESSVPVDISYELEHADKQFSFFEETFIHS